jgi:hypothetical protein
VATGTGEEEKWDEPPNAKLIYARALQPRPSHAPHLARELPSLNYLRRLRARATPYARAPCRQAPENPSPGTPTNLPSKAFSTMADENKEESKQQRGLDEGDIQLLKTYVRVAADGRPGERGGVAISPPSPRDEHTFARATAALTHSPPPPPASRHRLFPQGVGPYHGSIKKLEKDIEEEMKRITDLIGA